jgi:hypothetical protein
MIFIEFFELQLIQQPDKDGTQQNFCRQRFSIREVLLYQNVINRT